MGGNVQESKLIERVDPIYPELAKRARVSGRVVMMVTVDEQGYVADVRVMEGHPLLNDAAVTAVKKWRYSPTSLNGEPVPVIATVTVVFALRDDNGPVTAASSQLEPLLAQRKALLEQLSAQYTPNHPEIVRLQREIHMLEMQIQSQAAGRCQAVRPCGQGCHTRLPPIFASVYLHRSLRLSSSKAEIFPAQ